MAKTYESDGYCGVKFAGGEFYYGHQKNFCPICKVARDGSCEQHPDEDDDWCFVATDENGEVLLIVPFSQMGFDNFETMWKCQKCLLTGISIYHENLKTASQVTNERREKSRSLHQDISVVNCLIDHLLLVNGMYLIGCCGLVFLWCVFVFSVMSNTNHFSVSPIPIWIVVVMCVGFICPRLFVPLKG